MSIFSGKCDLYDFIMMEKQYPSPCNPNVLVSDELECFELFKAATGGVIYKHVKVEVSTFNQDLVAKLCKHFTFKEIPKTNERQKQKYTYTYFGDEVTLKELNKEGMYVNVPIYFKSLLDIIPYYPYIVTSSISENGKQRITISSRSYVDVEFERHLKYGYLSSIDYKKLLQEHYIEVINRYFNIEGRKVTKTFEIKPDTDLTKFNIGEALDDFWDVDVERDKTCWIYSLPKVVDADNGIIDISCVWPEKSFDKITLTYVKKQEKKLYLE